jgi:predicted TIM-barrel fold metal-dependent hydrolase
VIGQPKNPLKTCLPPDPNPIKPSLALPPGACDAHCHVFGPAAKFPYAADRSYTPADAPVETLRRLHTHLGISRAVIVHASCHGTQMDVTLDAIASSKGTYRGVACVEDGVTDRELMRLHEGGIRGIRFNFVKHLGGVPDLAVFYRLLARIKPLGWHVVLHFDAEDILTRQELLGRIDVPFIIDHMGRVKAAEGLEQRPFQSLLDLYRGNPPKSAARSAYRSASGRSAMRYRSRRRWLPSIPTAFCGVPIGRIRISPRRCRTTASWSTSSGRFVRTKLYKSAFSWTTPRGCIGAKHDHRLPRSLHDGAGCAADLSRRANSGFEGEHRRPIECADRHQR